jgi:prepilin-type N-terminal cleavage/methylation domain-containing protein
MSRGFTLIEVLVSIIILSVVVVGLFEISSNNKNNFMFLTNKNEFDRLSSLAFIHNDQKHHNSDKELYELIRADYTIDDDDLRKYLKEKKIHYTHEEFTIFNPLDDSSEDEGSESSQEDKNETGFNFALVYDKITVSDKENSTYAYKIYLQE